MRAFVLVVVLAAASPAVASPARPSQQLAAGTPSPAADASSPEPGVDVQRPPRTTSTGTLVPFLFAALLPGLRRRQERRRVARATHRGTEPYPTEPGARSESDRSIFLASRAPI